MVINFLSLSSHIKAPWMNLSKLQHNRTFFFFIIYVFNSNSSLFESHEIKAAINLFF
ncbi:hypothetical protein LguiA_011924 [Lonicera macranthoides]